MTAASADTLKGGKRKIFVGVEEYVHGSLQPGERIEEVAHGFKTESLRFGNRGFYSLCLTNRRFFIFEYNPLGVSGKPRSTMWDAQRSAVQVVGLKKWPATTHLQIRRTTDEKVFKLKIGRPWADEATRIAAALEMSGEEPTTPSYPVATPG